MAQPETEPSAEAQIDLQKRARRRLVGATALALLAAVVLPMVMDHEPKPQLQDIQIRIPSREKVEQTGHAEEEKSFASKILPIEPLPTPLPPVEVVEPAPAVVTKPAPVVAKPAPVEKPAPVAKPVPVTKPVPPPSEPEWVVQLGAYKDAANVKQLMAKIKELGLPAYTEPFDSPQGARTRVRAGPFASQEAALHAQTRLKVISLNGPIAKK